MRIAKDYKAAVRQGVNKYYGNPCTKGHEPIRYTKSRRCVECASKHSNTSHNKAKIEDVSVNGYTWPVPAMIGKARASYYLTRV